MIGAQHAAAPLPAVIVVMGVAGSGKTTIAALVAGHLHWEFAEADDFHPRANVQKMSAGMALTDDDRLPWLRAVAGWIDDVRQSGRRGVVACSALKRSYRALLIGGRPDVRLVYLQGDRQSIEQRMTARHGHYMPLTLLDSQLATLEEPGPDERPLVFSIAAQPQDIASRIIVELDLH